MAKNSKLSAEDAAAAATWMRDQASFTWSGLGGFLYGRSAMTETTTARWAEEIIDAGLSDGSIKKVTSGSYRAVAPVSL